MALSFLQNNSALFGAKPNNEIKEIKEIKFHLNNEIKVFGFHHSKYLNQITVINDFVT